MHGKNCDSWHSMDPLIVFLQAVVSGISIGCIFALVALGFVPIYKATEVVNFAQGELMMVDAFFAYTFVDLGASATRSRRPRRRACGYAGSRRSATTS